MITETLVKCSICGAPTEWDGMWGKKPLCVVCWDAQAEEDYEVNIRRNISDSRGPRSLGEPRGPCVKPRSECADCRDIFTDYCRFSAW